MHRENEQEMMSSMSDSYEHQSGVSMRDPAIVMDPRRLGAMHQTRLSFVRSLLRRMYHKEWQLNVAQWEISSQGFGVAIYKLTTPNQDYHLVIFSNEMNDEDRIDRVIAEKWDITFALVIGEIDENLLKQLQNNVPLQEAGRNSTQVIVLARANKSVRVFEHLVSSLAAGKQPDTAVLAQVGYILRTTAVYGNGKFGIADFEILQNNPDFDLSFSAQMCAVYILRQFSLDWVNDLAKQLGGEQAVELDIGLQRYLGVGNATGLGMAPYLINHPRIVDQWLSQREKVIGLISQKEAQEADSRLLLNLLQRARTHLEQVVTIDEYQQQLNYQAVLDLSEMIKFIDYTKNQKLKWERQIQYNQRFNLESQEVFLACLIECYPEVVDPFEESMNADESLSIPRGTCIRQMLEVLKSRYLWAIEIDFSQDENKYWFWYRSEDKEEPRLGVRGIEAGEDKELPLDVARQVNQLYQVLITEPDTSTLAEFLLASPQYAGIVRRVWTLGHCHMGDIQMNVLAKQALPMNLLRCKLSMFGATKFDPRSDRWVRVTLFQGAPLMNEIHPNEWLFPILPDFSSKSHVEKHA
ncbi:hypothetical protein GCM10007978_02610 [Shewanella hanedai]|nr:hypothetical protein [Shewanella hanedai]GGI68382.1 hypothetical protein GCM10007978_02610 [Shewanella hanedai]